MKKMVTEAGGGGGGGGGFGYSPIQIPFPKRHDEHAKTRMFRTGDLVYACNFSGNGPKWISWKVVAMTGSVSMVSKCDVILIMARLP